MEFWKVLEEHHIPFILLILSVIWSLLKVYALATFGVCRSKKRLDGKTVLITGCTSGIGKATAFELARRGARIIMACRNVEKSEQVKDQIIKETKNLDVVTQFVDMSLLQSVRKCAEEVRAREDRLDILIHNAGVVTASSTDTKEGLNTILATNVFGPFLLTHLLMDLLCKTENSRVVMVGSMIYRFGSLNLDNINPLEDPSPWENFTLNTYRTSKLVTTLCTIRLARLLSTYGVSVNCAHPGLVNTHIAGFCGPPFTHMLLPFVKTPEQGAQTTVFLAVSEELEGVTGKYFVDCKEGTNRGTMQRLRFGRSILEAL